MFYGLVGLINCKKKIGDERPNMFEKEAEEYKRLHTHYEVAKRENGAEYVKKR